MICKIKDLKVKHSRQLQSEIVTKTSEEAAFAGNDKEMIIVVSEAYLTANQFQKHKKYYLDFSLFPIRMVLYHFNSLPPNRRIYNCID